MSLGVDYKRANPWQATQIRYANNREEECSIAGADLQCSELKKDWITDMENIAVTINDKGIALLEMNRPETLNALNLPLMAEMIAELDSLAADDKVRALILTGTGRGFCAGADLSMVLANAADSRSPGELVAETMQQYFNPLAQRLYDFPKPVVTAVNGIAAGGGAALALCADIVLASDKAALKFVQVPQLGIVADLGANWLLPRIAGRTRALGACLFGETLSAATLKEWGMVWQCVDEERLMPRAWELADKLAALPPETVMATRRLIDNASLDTFQGMLEAERQYQQSVCDLSVFSDSVKRFLSK